MTVTGRNKGTGHKFLKDATNHECLEHQFLEYRLLDNSTKSKVNVSRSLQILGGTNLPMALDYTTQLVGKYCQQLAADILEVWPAADLVPSLSGSYLALRSNIRREAQ